MEKVSSAHNLSPNPPGPRVGYWLSAKKLKKMNMEQFKELCRWHGIDLVRLDLERPLHSQGPFQAILHKFSDVWTMADQGHTQAQKWSQNIQQFVDANPSLVLIDPLSSVRLLCDRGLQYSFINDVCQCDEGVLSPLHVSLTNLSDASNKFRAAGLKFPVVCKPLLAHGSSLAHQMSLVFCERGLSQVPFPCVAQAFIPHDAVLYKVFVVGKRHFVIPRPSLKNFEAGDFDTIFFDSHEISKDGCKSTLTELDEPVNRVCVPSDESVSALVKRIEDNANLSLFGADLVIEKHTNKCYVIDVNTFPGYDGVPDFFDHLLSLVSECLSCPPSRTSLSPPSLPLHSRSASDMCEYRGKSPATDSGIGSGTSESEISDCEKVMRWRSQATNEYFPDWNRIKRFYGIPKPMAQPVLNPDQTKQGEPTGETKQRSDTIP